MFARFRRRRINPVLRGLLEETRLSVDDFIYPLFIKPGAGYQKRSGLYARGISDEYRCGDRGVQ